MKIKWIGLNKLESVVTDNGESKQATMVALGQEAQIMFRNSQRLVPVQTGVLKASGTILPPQVIGSVITIDMGYGGAASAYAMRQHETEEYRHAAGKSWKYLEMPVRERIPALEQNLANRIRRILGSK